MKNYREKIIIPPVKSQGIKTKLIPDIRDLISQSKRQYNRWVEPFMGTGIVGFNCLSEIKHVMCDVNPHIVNLYKNIQSGNIDENSVREYLENQSLLLQHGEDDFYKKVRSEFNITHNSLDFLFLSRCCFNGMMRFNSKGQFNVPFCKKPNRLSKAYITKICNQVKSIRELIQFGDFEFRCQDFKETFDEVTENDFVYCDPPYSGCHTEYYSNWSTKDDDMLSYYLTKTSVDFIVSTWVKNSHKENDIIQKYYPGYSLKTIEHFYHVGPSESNRHPMIEGLIYDLTI